MFQADAPKTIMKQLIQKYNVTVNLFLTLVFVLNTLSPLSLYFNKDTLSDASVVQELFGGKILICTSSGYKYVSLEDFKNDLNTFIALHQGKEYNGELPVRLVLVHLVHPVRLVRPHRGRLRSYRVG